MSDVKNETVIANQSEQKEAEKIAEISKKFSVSKVTVYEDIKIAKERLSSLFFGIDGLKFF